MAACCLELAVDLFQDGFGVSLVHLLADFPVDDEPAAAAEDALQVRNSTANVDLKNLRHQHDAIKPWSVGESCG